MQRATRLPRLVARPMTRRSAVALGALAVWPYHSVARAADATPTATLSGLIDIGGRSLYLETQGTGHPTVILESGAGNDGRVWDQISLPPDTTSISVMEGVSAFTHVCSYDRPGTFLEPGLPGRSDPVRMPRTATEIVSDLHALLTTAEVPGPYVLVGHSFGGLIARLFASTWPDDVVGMVLIDSAHEDYYAAVQTVLTPTQWTSFANAPENPDYPGLERIDTETSANQMREAAMASPLRPMPLIVLTHGQSWEWPAGYPVAALEALWPPLQQHLASLVPDARLIVAEESGHFIQLQQPGLVIDAICQVVDAVRDPSTWDLSATPANGSHRAGDTAPR